MRWESMMQIKLRHVFMVTVIIIPLICVGKLKITDANYYHQSQASGILTMEECLNCHNGYGTNKPISVCQGNNCIYTNNHPLMHNYPPVGKEKDFASLIEIEQAGCILEDGKTTCLSCHDLVKPPPHIIRDGDKLCLICHKF